MLFDVGRDGRRLDWAQADASLVAPVEELGDGSGVGLTDVPVPDVGREKPKKRRLACSPAWYDRRQPVELDLGQLLGFDGYDFRAHRADLPTVR